MEDYHEDEAINLLRALVPSMVCSMMMVAVLRRSIRDRSSYPTNYPLICELDEITDEVKEQFRKGRYDNLRHVMSKVLEKQPGSRDMMKEMIIRWGRER